MTMTGKKGNCIFFKITGILQIVHGKKENL